MIVSTALLCLALNIYAEARGESPRGQYAVAFVTLNRAGHDKDQVCKEVFRKHQFSWTAGVKKTQSGWFVPNSLRPKEADAWRESRRVARFTLSGDIPNFTRGATHYHATYVHPQWASKMKFVKAIGKHRFYRKREKH